ncbi:MAG: hypothetical protein COB66_09375 [Coxiella sp. (in: Bacteria)]|nr:MAG: hypothetical protein COB66_09375 [Coxiella sp. (in: g-proteobacteria)]
MAPQVRRPRTLSLGRPIEGGSVQHSPTVAATLNVGLLLIFLLKRRIFDAGKGWSLYFVRLAVANVVMAVVIWRLAGSLQRWLDWGVLQRIEHLAWVIVAGLVSYLITLLITGLNYKAL